nr:hypothetical protein [Tanacetum cinerariifolium]
MGKVLRTCGSFVGEISSTSSLVKPPEFGSSLKRRKWVDRKIKDERSIKRRIRMSSGIATTDLFNMIIMKNFIFRKRNSGGVVVLPLLISSTSKQKVSNSGKELSKVLVSSKRELREVEGDLVLQSKDGVGLAVNASILEIRRFTFNNSSRKISSLIIKRMSSSIPPTSGITISVTFELTSSESGGDAST